ncbi:hypothetical protein N7528_003987 [Penicillium herquei]|nr:hypothetical protein N7528_003987 [Penicillium herquei]
MGSPSPVRRLRLSATEPVDPPPTARKMAQPGSIQATLQDNYRTRLYVHPIAWTDHQLQLLGLHFDQKLSKKKEKPVPPESQQSGCHNKGTCDTSSPVQAHRKELHLSQELIGAANRLIWDDDLPVKQYAMEQLLKAYNIHPFDKEYPFSRPVAKLRADRIFSSNPRAPSLAFVTPLTITLRRKGHVSARPDRKNPKPNNPVSRIERRKLDAILPPNSLEDPYIASILIALAQEKRRQHRNQEQEGPEKKDNTVTTRIQIEQVDADPILSVEELNTTCPLSSNTEQMNQNTVDSFEHPLRVSRQTRQAVAVLTKLSD